MSSPIKAASLGLAGKREIRTCAVSPRPHAEVNCRWLAGIPQWNHYMRGTLLLLPIAAMLAAPAGFAQTVRCESIANERQECRVDAPGELVLTRQLGTAACAEGKTWGVEGNVAWVRDGCRAEFTVVTPGGFVTCASNGKRTYCPAYVKYGARLEHQLSKSACTESGTWGYDLGGIWVQGGCQAVFALGDEKHLYINNYSPYAGSRTIGCGSAKNDTEECEADTRFGVSLTRQLSDKECLLNRTWGYDDKHIWVSHGCRGEFTLSH